MPVEDPDHVAIRDVAAGVVAPAMVGFTLWVLRRAEQLGLRRLYFVARDGQILVDVARRLIARLGLDIECVYLFGSRLAWWLPSLASVDESELEWAFATHDRIDARTVTNRLNLSPEVSADLLARAGLGDTDPRQLLEPEQLARLRAAVVSAEFADQLVDAAAAAREHLVGYLRQVGMMDGVPAAMVDIGWIGRMHVSLGKVLRAGGVEPPVGLFFGISGGAPNSPDGDREAYYFDARDPSGYASDIDAVVNMFDVFCTGFGGQTLRYERSPDGGFTPLFAADHDAAKSRWGLATLQGAVAHFTDVVVLDPDLVDVTADVRSGVDAVVRAFLDHPTAAEARAWGAFHARTRPAQPNRCWRLRTAGRTCWRVPAATRRRGRSATGSRARSRSRLGRCGGSSRAARGRCRWSGASGDQPAACYRDADEADTTPAVTAREPVSVRGTRTACTGAADERAKLRRHSR